MKMTIKYCLSILICSSLHFIIVSCGRNNDSNFSNDISGSSNELSFSEEILESSSWSSISTESMTEILSESLSSGESSEALSSSEQGQSFEPSSETLTYKKFDEEFVVGSTVQDYLNLEKYLFNSDVVSRPEGMEQEDYMNYREIDISPFQTKELYEKCKLIDYRYRSYYSAFYFKETRGTPNMVRRLIFDDDDSFIGMPDTTINQLINEHGTALYKNYFKFQNYSSLDEIPRFYEGFCLYNVIRLIDLYDETGYLNTTFDFNLFTINESDEVCFYQTKNALHFYTYDVPFDEKNSYFGYYNEERFANRNIIPYLPHPYWHDTPMVTRTEIDDMYAYTRLYNEKMITTGELLSVEKKIWQYNQEKQRSEEVIVTIHYSKRLIADLIPVD